MGKLLQMVGLALSEKEVEDIQKFKGYEQSSMRVVGRGTLTMSPSDARNSAQFKEAHQGIQSIFE